MARKPKAKRRGRPALTQGARRTNRSIRLPEALWVRAEGYCEAMRTELTATLEQALTAWLDEWEGRAHGDLGREVSHLLTL